jgi:hypothetical protein
MRAARDLAQRLWEAAEQRYGWDAAGELVKAALAPLDPGESF